MAKEMMKNKPVLHAEIGTIGDWLGVVPSLEALAAKYDGLNVIINQEIKTLFDLIPSNYNVTEVPLNTPYDYKFDVSQAFGFAIAHGLHMTQSYQHMAGLSTPSTPIRPELDIPNIEVPIYDYLIAPNSRCLPPEQRWQDYKWQQLVDRLPNVKFAMLGNSKYDNPTFIKAANVTNEFDRPFSEVSNLLMKSRKGVISIVTGISHLQFALNVPGYLLEFQTPTMGWWGVSPSANRITYPVSDIKVSDVIHFIGGL